MQYYLPNRSAEQFTAASVKRSRSIRVQFELWRRRRNDGIQKIKTNGLKHFFCL